MLTIGFDAKRIVRNFTGLGNYSRTLVNGLAEIVPQDTLLRLYAPDKGNERLREQVRERENVKFVYPEGQDETLERPLENTRHRGRSEEGRRGTVSWSDRRTAFWDKEEWDKDRCYYPRPYLYAPSGILQLD